MSPSQQKLPTRQLIVGAFAAPMVGVILSSQGVNICTGICAVMTLITWFILYQRFMAAIRSLGFGRRPTYTEYQQLPVEPTARSDDSNSIFL